MTPREIREHLGRVKTYYLRNEMLRALASAIKGLQGIGNTLPPTELRSAIREALQLLSRDQLVIQHLKAPLAYQPGQERIMLGLLADVYKTLRAAEEAENHDDTLARKIRLDQAYNQGLKLLEQGKASDADASFAEALKNYKDEHRVLSLMAKAFMDAGEVRRALPYFKRAVEVTPENTELLAQMEECVRQRDAQKE